MLAFFIVFVRQLINNSLPFLKQFGRSRDDGLWNLTVLSARRLTCCILGDHMSNVARFEIFLINWQSVKHTEYALNDLNWRIAVIRIALEPHLEEPTSVVNEEHLLNMLLVHKISQLTDHLEPVHGRLTSLDCIVIAEAHGMHFLNQTNCLNLALLIKLFLLIDSFGQFLRKLVIFAAIFPKLIFATTLES